MPSATGSGGGRGGEKRNTRGREWEILLCTLAAPTARGHFMTWWRLSQYPPGSAAARFTSYLFSVFSGLPFSSVVVVGLHSLCSPVQSSCVSLSLVSFVSSLETVWIYSVCVISVSVHFCLVYSVFFWKVEKCRNRSNSRRQTEVLAVFYILSHFVQCNLTCLSRL